MKTIKLYFRFLAVHLKTAMAYKGSFILSCIGQLLITTNVFLGVKFLLDRFGSVGGYRLPELTLCYSVILLSCSLAECFGRGFDAFPRILSSAQCDRILVRPRGIIFQILCQDMDDREGNDTCRHGPLRFRAVFRTVSALCGAVLFYDGGTGSKEYLYRRCQRIWKISIWNLWKRCSADHHVDCPSGPRAILAPAVPSGSRPVAIRAFTAAFAAVPDSSLLFLEVWRCPLPLHRVIIPILQKSRDG